MIILPLLFHFVCLICLSHLTGISYLKMLIKSVIHRTFRKVNHMSGHRENLSKFGRMEIVQTTSSDHNTTEVVMLVMQ